MLNPCREQSQKIKIEACVSSSEDLSHSQLLIEVQIGLFDNTHRFVDQVRLEIGFFQFKNMLCQGFAVPAVAVGFVFPLEVPEAVQVFLFEDFTHLNSPAYELFMHIFIPLGSFKLFEVVWLSLLLILDPKCPKVCAFRWSLRQFSTHKQVFLVGVFLVDGLHPSADFAVYVSFGGSGHFKARHLTN